MTKKIIIAATLLALVYGAVEWNLLMYLGVAFALIFGLIFKYWWAVFFALFLFIGVRELLKRHRSGEKKVRLRDVVKEFKVALIGTVALGLLLSFGISTMHYMPRNARLLVDPQAGEYISPPCLPYMDNPYRFSVVTTHSDVRETDLIGNDRCVQANGFYGESESLFWHYLIPHSSR